MQRYLPLLALLLCVGCGEPDTEDDRPFAKPPLADPDLRWEGEVETAMDELGDPRRQVPLAPDGTPAPIDTSSVPTSAASDTATGASAARADTAGAPAAPAATPADTTS
ncbi:MAG: hypothetical protein ACRELV_16405 [Longimicrobiales bacterium]